MRTDISTGRERAVCAIGYERTQRWRIVCICICICIAALLCTVLPPLQASAQDIVPGLLPDKALKAGALTKVDGNLLQLSHEHAAWQAQGGAAAMGAFKPSKYRMAMRGLNNVVVDATAQGNIQDLEDDLGSLGCTIVSVHQRMVSTLCPIAAIDYMAPLKSLNFVRPALFTTNRGAVTSQGDAAIRADIARPAYAVDGSGIVIGTLSDGYNCLGGAAADVASGDLPAAINVLDDTVCPATDEGRALMQLIADVAPGADQAFHTATNGEADFANGIIELYTVAGSNVIMDDITYFAEPMFQDGVIAQAVDTVKAAGVAYFTSAGNQRRDSYEATFNPSGVTEAFWGGALHDFDPGSGLDVYQTVSLRGGGLDTFFSYQWDEPYFKVSGAPGSASDYDIFICLDDTQPVNAANCPVGSTNANVGSDPIEVLGVTVDGGNLTAYLAISRYSGASNNLLKIVAFGGSTFSFNEWNTASASIYGHRNAAGAETVGAVFYYNSPAFGTTTPILNGFSSAGGIPILFDTAGNPTSIIRQKPEISAPDGTNTTFFGIDIADPGDGSDFDTFPNFFGTSAAAPHAAGVAALMLEAVGGPYSCTPDEIYAWLESTAIDITRRSPEVFPPVDPRVNNLPVGFDLDSGYGLIQADAAVGSAPLTLAGPLVSAVLPASRSVQVGDTATAFATIINTGGAIATDCGIAPLTSVPANFTFSYQTTDAANALVGTPDTPVDIAASGNQSYVFACSPTASFGPVDVQLAFDCSNTGPAPVTVGLNTLLLVADSDPVPDIVALVATLNGDGIVNLASTGVFAVATVNVGIASTITVSADTGSTSLPVSIARCETNPATGVCINPTVPTLGTVTTSIAADATPTFAFFVTGTGTVPFDPANNRIFVRFRDAGGVTRGSTSVAVRTL